MMATQNVCDRCGKVVVVFAGRVLFDKGTSRAMELYQIHSVVELCDGCFDYVHSTTMIEARQAEPDSKTLSSIRRHARKGERKGK